MLNRLRRYLDSWRSGVLAVVIHHCLLLILERHNEFKENVFDYIDALPYHFLNSVAYIWEPKTNLPFDPLWLEAYEWLRRGWPSWVLLIALTSIQWFIFGAAVGKAISLFRKGANRAQYWQTPIIKLLTVTFLAYLLWYGWITAYSNRWYLRRYFMGHYELCGIVNTAFPESSEAQAWKAKENAARAAFFKAYQSGSAARIASFGYSEEYPPDKSWLIIERAAKPVREITYVMDLLGSVRFRDFLYRGWAAESTDEFEEMKLLTYSEAKELYSQSRNLRFGQAGDRCLMNAIGFFHDGTGLIYLAVYRKNDEKGRVADIY
jgi:hypothetical protein